MRWQLVVCCGPWLLLLSHGVLSRPTRDSRAVTFVRNDRSGPVRSRSRRSWTSAESFISCNLPLSQSEHGVLDENTHETGFHGDDGSSFTLTWVGDGTGVILLLSTISAPIDSFFEGGSSRLYRSIDYGKSFRDISSLINNTFIRKDFAVSAGPGNSQQVILTADLPITETPGGIIFTSDDAGLSFKSITLPFHPAQPITFHFQIPSYLVTISIDGGLWISLDFGNRWMKIHEGVNSFMWGSDITLYFSYSPKGTVEADRRGDLSLKRTKDLGKTFSTIAQNIFSFGYIGGFLFTSVMAKMGSPRVLYVSSDHGDSFNKALLPSASTEQFYSVLDGDEYMIFMHVDTPGDGLIRTVISFDRGGEWRLLTKPDNVDCGKGMNNCNLHIHGETSLYNGITPMLPLSDPAAIGLVIAHGSTGDSISSMRPDVYISRDGGYTWKRTLKGPHHYSILDSGGLIVAVESRRDQQVNSIKFSTDEGQCWKSYNFTDHPIFLAGLASEPGAKTMNISVWGYRPEDDDQPMWVAVTIDFQHLLTRECGDLDYVEWLAHSTGGGVSEANGCVLGYKETFRRLRSQSVCRNGRDYVVSRKHTPCQCTIHDYMCDYGYYRHENSSECVKETGLSDKPKESCENGEEVEPQTSGYQKIPSDKCEGGFTPKLPNARNCGNNSLNRILAYVGVGIAVLLLITITVIVVRRVSAIQRTPDYHFSALQLNEDNQSTRQDSGSLANSNQGSCETDSDDVLIE
ncbi:sortilin isoform X2 [Denticeps clupeoides]|uniref:sortilin isoform X2 n=1 Tax=Denticeps clupeoides TaxID=299321 RepID=UPI0010A53656|nr:sortilin-like isoform X2 [Denticeps clupeoides]